MLARRVDRFERRYRAIGYARNKPQGYEVMQIRLSGQAARWRELHLRLEALAVGPSGPDLPLARDGVGQFLKKRLLRRNPQQQVG